jgi:methyl-accepting chemotaxis protein
MKMIPKISKSGFKPFGIFKKMLQIPSLREPFHQLWNAIYKPSTALRFKTIFIAFLVLSGLEVLLGFSFVVIMNNQLIHIYQNYQSQAEIVHDLQNRLTSLIAFYADKTPGDNAGAQVRYKGYLKIKQLTNQLPIVSHSGTLQKLRRGIGKLDRSIKKPTPNEYEIKIEAIKAKGYLHQYLKQLDTQKHRAIVTIYRNTWSMVLGLLFVILAGLAFLLKAMVHEGKSHQKAIHHFENIAERLKKGEINPGVLPYKTVELETLQVALEDYLKRLAERYRSILNKIDEFAPAIYQLGEWIHKNDSQHINIKKKLEDLANQIYGRLEKFPDLSGQIQHINKDFMVSQDEAKALQNDIQSSRDLLSADAEQIRNYYTQAIEKGRYYQGIANSLKELKELLDEIQQTVTSFYSIAEQTSLLSLNASIEAARAGEAGDNFDIAALEIEELAAKISKASKELLNLSVSMGKKTTTVIRALELIINSNKAESKYLDDIYERIQNFILQLSNDLERIKGYGSVVNEYEVEEQTLENIASILSGLKEQSPVSRGKASAAIEVIVESDKLVAAVSELADNLSELQENLAQIKYQSNLEEQS